MKLTNFMLADAIATDSDGKVFIHGGGLAGVMATAFPWTHPQLALLLSLEREEEAFGADHTVTVNVVGPSGEIHHQFETNFRIDRGPDPDLPERVNFIISANGLQFPEECVYAFVALFDGDELGRYLIRASVSGPSPPDPQQRTA
jgi:hypothetical protein